MFRSYYIDVETWPGLNDTCWIKHTIFYYVFYLFRHIELDPDRHQC